MQFIFSALAVASLEPAFSTGPGQCPGNPFLTPSSPLPYPFLITSSPLPHPFLIPSPPTSIAIKFDWKTKGMLFDIKLLSSAFLLGQTNFSIVIFMGNNFTALQKQIIAIRGIITD